MPGRFLTDAERERLTRFPAEVPPEDLVNPFILSPEDITRVLLHRGQPNYLGFALQMCALRYLGFAPDDLLTAPASVIKYVARQLGVSPEALKQYGSRPQTRTDHLQEILSYLEFREAGATDLQALATFLLERALEHDRPIILFQVGKKSTNQALQRTPPERRYTILVAFLRQVAEELMDEVMDLFDRCMAQVDARARRDLEEFRRNAARATNEKVAMFTDLTGMILDPQIADPDLRTHIYKRHPKEQLQAAMEESERLMRPLDDNYFDFLTGRYNYVRQFAPAFLSAFTFRANRRGEPLVQAVSVLNRIKRKVPENAPVGFVPAKWRP